MRGRDRHVNRGRGWPPQTADEETPRRGGKGGEECHRRSEAAEPHAPRPRRPVPKGKGGDREVERDENRDDDKEQKVERDQLQPEVKLRQEVDDDHRNRPVASATRDRAPTR